jgi:aerobic-type carbon monoxide dehydrogenase small subunit (CoxS/CutS family)
MTAKRPLTLQVNGAAADTEAAFTDTLLTVLRDRLGLTAAKRGCNQGVCGACTIAVDGVPMRACLSLAHNCTGVHVTTLEGAGNDRTMRALQDAFEAMGAMQCGFCTPGMLMAARALLVAHPRPTVDDVRAALSGNLCRCTGYRKIIDAVRAAAGVLREEA